MFVSAVNKCMFDGMREVKILYRIMRADDCPVVVAQRSEHGQLKPATQALIPSDYCLFPFFCFASYRQIFSHELFSNTHIHTACECKLE